MTLRPLRWPWTHTRPAADTLLDVFNEIARIAGLDGSSSQLRKASINFADLLEEKGLECVDPSRRSMHARCIQHLIVDCSALADPTKCESKHSH